MEQAGFFAGIVIGIAKHVGYAAAPAVQTLLLGLILFSLSSWFAGRGLWAPFFAVWAVIAIGFAQVWKIVLVAMVALDIIFWAAFLTSYGLSTTIRFCASTSYHKVLRKPAVKKYQEAEAHYQSVYHGEAVSDAHSAEDNDDISDVLNRQDRLIASRNAESHLKTSHYNRPTGASTRGDAPQHHRSTSRRTPRRYESSQPREAVPRNSQRHRESRLAAASGYDRYESGEYDDKTISRSFDADDGSGSISKASQEPKTARNLVSQLLHTLKRNDILP